MSSTSVTPDLQSAAEIIDLASRAVGKGLRQLVAIGGADKHQVLAYDLAHAASAVETARSLLDYGAKGDHEGLITCAFTADMAHELMTKLIGREALWGLEVNPLAAASSFITIYRDPEFVASLADVQGPRHLDSDFEMVQDTFRSFSDKVIAPRAEHVHRYNEDVPEEIISGLAEMGAFGLSVPVEYGGFSEGGEGEYLAMVVATEELSRCCSDRTRLRKRRCWTQSHRKSGRRPDGEAGYVINGVKTWCTFAGRADVLMLLARTDPDRSKTHRGLSLFIVPKPRGEAHGFEFTQNVQPDGSTGKMEGRPIDTIGYRGMHSYEIALENWWVPATNLIGEEGGLGKGFYYQMEGFENGRLQTAARAVGLMQAAYEAAYDYAHNRNVFGNNIAEYQLTQVKLGRMAVLIQAGRQFGYQVSKLMAKGEGTTEASMVKAYVCKAAEWVAREAMQIHGGYGYAEEYSVSRLFVDARVLSIFEGADETLCLKVIARRLVETA